MLDTLGAIQRGEVHGRKEDKRSTIKRSYRCSYSDTSRDNRAHMDFSKLALSLEGECWSYRAQQYVSIFNPFIHLFYPFIITPSLLCYHHNHLSSYSVINYLISVLHNTSFFMLMFSFSSLNFSSKVET